MLRRKIHSKKCFNSAYKLLLPPFRSILHNYLMLNAIVKKKKSIAILPFQNAGNDGMPYYFWFVWRQPPAQYIVCPYAWFLYQKSTNLQFFIRIQLMVYFQETIPRRFTEDNWNSYLPDSVPDSVIYPLSVFSCLVPIRSICCPMGQI